MAFNFWGACQTGAASIRRGGATIRLFPTNTRLSLEEKLKRKYEKFYNTNERIRQTLDSAHKSAAQEVEETR